MSITLADRAAGCLLAGAAGDALGAPVEFGSLSEIRRIHGPGGITRFAPAYGRRGAITDDTQMTLWTAEGLLRAWIAAHRGETVSIPVHVYRAYLRWLATQGGWSPDPIFADATRREDNGWLVRVADLRHQRGPGSTCLASLGSGVMGTVEAALNHSKGCGGVMRMAPVGLLHRDAKEAFDLGCELAAITHGHPCGYLSAGTLAAIVSCLALGQPLREAVDWGLALLAAAPRSAECLAAVRRGVDMVGRDKPASEVVESVGKGWVGEEALAIALYCALSFPTDLRRAVVLAVNHSGDSDSTGAICGNLLGTALGAAAIPPEWLQELELRDEIAEVAGALASPKPADGAWAERWAG